MFYTYLKTLIYQLFWAINGNIHINRFEKLLPNEQNYVLVAPHKTFMDPIYMGYAASPKKFLFMAKKELFKNRAFGWWIRMCGAFPIDRENPGTEAIRMPVRALKSGKRSLVMFPSGSRHSDDVKGGVAIIAKTAKVAIMPIVIDGPMTFKEMFKGGRINITFGEVIDISDITRMDDDGRQEVANRIDAAFDECHRYNTTLMDKRVSRLSRCYRWPYLALLLIVLVITYIFSYLASFVWVPENHRKD